MKYKFQIDCISDAANFLMNEIPSHRHIAFYGDMGAGKTSLIAALCKQLGVVADVSSPTYALVQEYGCGALLIVHMDWYRLVNVQQALEAGLLDYLDKPNTRCLVEWPSVLYEVVDSRFAKVKIEVIDEYTRELEIV